MNGSIATVDEPPEGRCDTRTHLFVAATLYADAGSAPVNIRNMSRSGALIEGGVLPEVGERITLKRGQLQATGWVAWRVDRKAGLRLDAAVHMPDWLSRKGSGAQERVDALLSMVRGSVPIGAAVAAEIIDPASTEAELRQLRLELQTLETALLNDVIMVATHPEIQTIDISIQRIDRLLGRLRAGG